MYAIEIKLQGEWVLQEPDRYLTRQEAIIEMEDLITHTDETINWRVVELV